jgi:hypothetical protein
LATDAEEKHLTLLPRKVWEISPDVVVIEKCGG